ncbi:hypothetical protein OUZ56_024074 [Daphnia magna]|uniref:Uncharacterized protein n=1 Tax=Daphnia magna TaxID=35525 RepID=A0ABR0B083_9CRUS|nr:hypothetical protein OUZ56_024074 [Daphnia magna]
MNFETGVKSTGHAGWLNLDRSTWTSAVCCRRLLNNCDLHGDAFSTSCRKTTNTLDCATLKSRTCSIPSPRRLHPKLMGGMDKQDCQTGSYPKGKINK